jgi:hypothetical protein
MIMSVTASALGKLTDPKQQFDPINFDPRPLFSPRQLTLSSSNNFPAHLPKSFVLTPEVKSGNIKLTVSNVEFNSPAPNPTWRFREGTVNGSDAVSIVMEDNLRDLLVLTGDMEGDAAGAENSWNSKVLGRLAQGTWSQQQLGGISTFSDRFSWTFLLDPGEGAPEDDPETVILEFDILVGETGGILQQLSSFPPNWEATNFEVHDDGSISLELTDTDSQEEYALTGGFFTGGLGALVCQGNMTISTVQKDRALVPVDGTWTGTSGGPG